MKIDGIFIAQGVAGSTDFAKKLGAKIENDKIEIIRIRKLYNQKRNIKRKQYVCFNVRKTKRNIYIAVFT